MDTRIIKNKKFLIKESNNELSIVLEQCRYSELEEHFEELRKYIEPESILINYNSKYIHIIAQPTDNYITEQMEHALQNIYDGENKQRHGE